jgi:hypothetical protein
MQQVGARRVVNTQQRGEGRFGRIPTAGPNSGNVLLPIWHCPLQPPPTGNSVDGTCRPGLNEPAGRNRSAGTMPRERQLPTPKLSFRLGKIAHSASRPSRHKARISARRRRKCRSRSIGPLRATSGPSTRSLQGNYNAPRGLSGCAWRRVTAAPRVSWAPLSGLQVHASARWKPDLTAYPRAARHGPGRAGWDGRSFRSNLKASCVASAKPPGCGRRSRGPRRQCLRFWCFSKRASYEQRIQTDLRRHSAGSI